LIVNASSAEFRKSKRSNWQTVGAPAPTNSDQAAADAIISQTVAENAQNNPDNDEAPQIEMEEDIPAQMESGAHAGLQSAAQVTAALAARKAEEFRRFKEQGDAASGKGSETIYRDASGRIINVAMKRAEARKAAEEEERKQAAEEQAKKGDVQNAARAARREQLEEAKFMPVARTIDDVEMNEELKGEARWNDPAAGFLENKKKAGKSVSGKPLYKGAAMPNRYGIRPGHRWDGVDRGNGWEAEIFKARNKRTANKDLSYAWQMDE
jgi:pre-mRNA-splicing factor CWC26